MAIGPARGGASDGAGMRCTLCGEPNDCAQAAVAARGKGEARAAEPCWCVGRAFPRALLERAAAVDGGAACICRRCLAAAEND